jgi:hypothetical protein
MLDTSSGVLFPKFDEDTNCVYVGGKGDGNIRYFEMDDASPYSHNLSEFKSATPQRGIGWLPKSGMDLNACQVMKAYKLTAKGAVEVIGFTVPRKSTLFQDDIFPPTREPVAVLTAEEWATGQTKPPNKMSLKDNFVSASRAGSGSAPTSAKAVSYGASGGGSSAPKKPIVVKPKAAPGTNPYAKKAPGTNPYAKSAEKAAAPPVRAAIDVSDDIPSDVEGLTEAYETHVKEIKAYKMKLATKEIEIARLKKEIATLNA